MTFRRRIGKPRETCEETMILGSFADRFRHSHFESMANKIVNASEKDSRAIAKAFKQFNDSVFLEPHAERYAMMSMRLSIRLTNGFGGQRST
jgi:hypothetical protein